MPLVGPGPEGVDGALGVIGAEGGDEGRPPHDATSAAKHTATKRVCVWVMRNLPDRSARSGTVRPTTMTHEKVTTANEKPNGTRFELLNGEDMWFSSYEVSHGQSWFGSRCDVRGSSCAHPWLYWRTR